MNATTMEHVLFKLTLYVGRDYAADPEEYYLPLLLLVVKQPETVADPLSSCPRESSH